MPDLAGGGTGCGSLATTGMMAARSFRDLREQLGERDGVTLVVAGVATPPVVTSLVSELRDGLLRRVILAGPPEDAKAAIHLAGGEVADFEIRPCAAEPAALAAEAVRAAREGDAGVLMKGHIDSPVLVKALLNRDTGLRSGGLLSNLTVFAEPRMGRLLGITDNGIVPAPDVEQKRAILLNALPLFEALGISPVRVALVAASEKVLPTLQGTVDAAALKALLATEDALQSRCLVDGPFGYDVCVSPAAARAKGIVDSPVAGNPDLLLFHDIEAANAVAKAIKFHGDATSGGLLLGCRVPVLFNSRSDDAQRRRNSLLLACVLAAAD